MLLLAAAGAAAAGCRSSRSLPVRYDDASVPPRTNDPDSQLDQVAEEHIAATWSESPTTATWMGVHDYDDQLDDTSRSAQTRRAARIEALAARLETLPESRLDPRRRIDRRLLEREIDAARNELVSERPLERNPVRYIALITAGIGELLAHEDVPLAERLRLTTARLGAVRSVLDEARRNLRNPPELATRRAIDLSQTARSFLADTLPRIATAAGDESLVGPLRAAAGSAVKVLDEWIVWLQRDLLPHSKGELAAGAQRLAERLQAVERLDVSLDVLLNAGERELALTRSALGAAAGSLAPGKTVADALRLLEDDHPSAEDLLPTFSATLERMTNLVRDRRLMALGPVQLRVAEMPPYLWGGISVTLWGPFEPHLRDGWLYVEPVERSWDRKQREEHLRALSRSQIVLSTLHEGIPGHFLAQQALTRAPSPLEKLVRSEAFVEGWADYAEQLLIGQSPRDNPALRLGLAREQAVRLCRLVGALRFHAFGAKFEDLVRLFSEAAFLDEYGARREADQVALDPMLLLPAMGRLQIWRLREDYRHERGEQFTLTEFHDRLLAHGAEPLVLVRRILLISPGGPSL